MASVRVEPVRFRNEDKADEPMHVQRDARRFRTFCRISRNGIGRSAWHSSGIDAARGYEYGSWRRELDIAVNPH